MRSARVIDPHEWEAATDVGRVGAAARVAQQAAEDYAAVLAGVAAALVRASLPGAQTLMFDVDIRDGATDITVLTIRDLNGALLWHGDDFYQPSPDELTTGIALLDDGAVEAITNTIQEAYDVDRGVFATVNVIHPDLLGMNLLELNIPTALRRRATPLVNTGAVPRSRADTAADCATAPASIDPDLLAAILAQKTSVVDPADVNALMAVVRAAANRRHTERPTR
jgi:hypothetical protein